MLFYLENIDDFSNKDVQEMAATELVSLCESYSVTNEDRIFPFLKERIPDQKYRPIRISLLQTLLNITRNSTPDQIREKIHPIFEDILRRLLFEPQDEEEMAIHIITMNILTSISEGDEGFKDMTTLLTGLIEMKDNIAERAEELILTKYPQKKSELRRALFKLLTSQDRDVIRRAKERIVQLRMRKPPNSISIA